MSEFGTIAAAKTAHRTKHDEYQVCMKTASHYRDKLRAAQLQDVQRRYILSLVSNASAHDVGKVNQKDKPADASLPQHRM